MNEFARDDLKGMGFRLEAAGRQWGILDGGRAIDLLFDGQNVGVLHVDSEVQDSQAKLFAGHVAALVHAGDNRIDEMLAVLGWLRGIKNLRPNIFHWVGVYYRASYLKNENSNDLVLGPFLGEPTEHVRISLNQGLCGLALREGRIVNEPDVLSDSRHIACSLTTRSELVIPLPLGRKDDYIAELDIDSNLIGAFNSEIEREVLAECLKFPFS